VDHVAGVADELAELDDDGRGEARLTGWLGLASDPAAHLEALLVLSPQVDSGDSAHFEEGLEEAPVALIHGKPRLSSL
jgi:hypothetical protein